MVISRRGCHSERRDRFPRVARTSKRLPYLYTPRMISAALCVLYALLAVRAVAVHDGKNHVSLKVLDENQRGSTLSPSTTGWLTPHFAHRVPSLRKGERSADCGTKWGCVGGDVRNPAAHYA